MLRPLLLATITVMATSAATQHIHQSGAITETGQAQFAAIAEIVAALRADAETDWAHVDIDGLRDHLVDMDNVTTAAKVAQKVDGLSVTFTVTGNSVVAESIERMVLAHSPMLQDSTGWRVAAHRQDDGATMVVDVTSNAELQEVTGLGFFGLMTIGAHHQQHHLMIARGHAPH